MTRLNTEMAAGGISGRSRRWPKLKAYATSILVTPPIIRSDHHAGRTWGKKGETPIVTATGHRHGNEPDFSDHFERSHAVHDQRIGGVNADVFIEFLKRVL